MSPSRRQFLGSAGVALAGALAPTTATASPAPSLDWPMDRCDPAGTGYLPTASGPKDGVEVTWSHETTDWFLGTAPPIRLGDTIYAVGSGFLALDADTGTKRFGAPGPYQSAPARVPAPAYTTDTLAVTAPSGVFGLNADGGVNVPFLDRSLGAQRWAGPRSPGAGFFGPAASKTPVAADGVVYTAIPGTNSVSALDPNDGSVLWRHTHHKNDAVSADFNRPAVREGLVYVTNWPNQATAYRAESGERQWRRELDEQMVLAPVATEAGVVVPTRSGVRLLDAEDGTTLWRRSLDGNMTEGAPAVAEGTIFIGDERSTLHAVDVATGEVRWTTPFEGPTSPVVADGVVYAVRAGFSLLAFDAASGEILFEYRPSQVPLSTPVVGDGVLYATNRRRVIALEEPA